jgi:hypothetical protein
VQPHKSGAGTSFQGNTSTPPKKPDFLKHFDTHPLPKGPTGVKSAIITLGVGGAIVGFTALCFTFLPAAIASIPIFIGVMAITFGGLNWLVPTKIPKGRTPLTPEQQIEASKYEKELRAYNRNQQWFKFKQQLISILK